MKNFIAKAGTCAVLGAVILSAHVQAEENPVAPIDQSRVQTMVDTMDAALTLGMTASHGSGSIIRREYKLIDNQWRKKFEIVYQRRSTP